MNECYEVACSLVPFFTETSPTFDDCRRFVRSQMRDESDVVIDNVAESLHEQTQMSFDRSLERLVLRAEDDMQQQWYAEHPGDIYGF